MKKSAALFLVLGLAFFIKAGETPKKILDHDVYDSWNDIQGTTLSPDGRWVAYQLEPQLGDGRLVLVDLENDKSFEFERGYRAAFMPDSRCAVFLVKPGRAELKEARRKKLKPEQMPRDGLTVLKLDDGKLRSFERVLSFQVPREAGAWLVLHFAPVPPPEKESAEPDKSAPAEKKPASKKDSDEPEKGRLIALEPLSGREIEIPDVSSYVLDQRGGRLLFVREAGDVDLGGVSILEPESGRRLEIKAGPGLFKNPVFSENGDRVVFLGRDKAPAGSEGSEPEKEKEKKNKLPYSLYHWQVGQERAGLLVGPDGSGLQLGWRLSEHAPLVFSKSGGRVFLGVAPPPVEAEAEIPEDEKTVLDVWHWQDPLIQPQQLKNLEEEGKRSYRAVFHLSSGNLVQLAAPDLEEAEMVREGEADFVLAWTNAPYRRRATWEGRSARDLYLVDLKKGGRRLLAAEVPDWPRISPRGAFAAWFDPARGQWLVLNIAEGRLHNLTAGLPVSFANEQDDTPDHPRAYGAAGWLENERGLLVYDRYDIWLLDPSGRRPARRLTAGREQRLVYRRLALDPREKAIDPKSELFLRYFNEVDKSSGYCRLAQEDGALPAVLFQAEAMLGNPLKASGAERYVFTRGNFRDFPDLYTCDASFREPRRISRANPQQSEYLWGSVELVAWTSLDGKNLQGLLYKPEYFSAGEKYPMIVYFYERLSDSLHRHYAPAPSRSTINPTFYCSRGYLVFMPDVVYLEGYPGQSALNAIVPGVLNLVEKGFVDSDRIGIQGQSWGGYQVAHLITRTNLFRAAMAGAPVVNMTSAYGGIRWGSGMSRIWQYEKSQSRIGASLWERPLHYLDNSPLFRAQDVNTPLLMMHNDGDGAVPWYQGIEMFMALRRLEKPVWLLNYNGEEHNLTRRPNMKDLARRMQQFFDHFLLDAPAPRWLSEGLPALEKGLRLGLEEVSGKN